MATEQKTPEEKEIATSVEPLYQDMLASYESLKASLAKIADIENDAKAKLDKIYNYTERLFADEKSTDTEESIEDSIKGFLDESSSNSVQIEKYFIEIKNIHGKIVSAYNDIFGSSFQEEREITTKEAESLVAEKYNKREDGTLFIVEQKIIEGKIAEFKNLLSAIKAERQNFENEFTSLMKKIKDDIQDENKIFIKEHDELKKQIEGFLPGATAVGLAEAYDKAKNKQEEQIKSWKNIFSMTMLMMILTVFIFYLVGAYSLSAMEIKEIFVQFIKILPVEFPLIWLGLVANKKINQHTRLHEEYLHKWSVARTFEGLRQKTEGINDDEISQHLNDLFSNFIRENAINPSGTLEKTKADDSPLQKIAGLCLNKKNSIKEDSSGSNTSTTDE